MDAPARHKALIEQFLMRGYHAQFRQWALGDTILVAAEPQEASGGIRFFKRWLYLIPSGPDSWAIDIGISDPTPIPESQVVERVAALLNSQEAWDREHKSRARRLHGGPKDA